MVEITTPAIRNLVIVLVEDHPKAILLLRMARKRAQERQCKWRAVFAETPAHHKHDNGSQQRILQLLTTAEQMGGESEQFEASSIEKGMKQLCQRESTRIELIIIGGTQGNGYLSRFKLMPWMRTIRAISSFAQVEILPLSGSSYRKNISDFINWRTIKPLHFVYALVAVGSAYLGASLLEKILPPALFRMNDYNIALLFMISCAFVAGRYGLLPGLVASVGSFITMNYYFTLPYHQLKVFAVTDIINMVLFLSAALLISLFTSQTRGYAEKAKKRELSTQVLFTLYRIAAESFSRQQAIEKLQSKLERMLDVDVAFFLPDILNVQALDTTAPEGVRLTDADRRALDVCWRETKTTGIASPYNPGTNWRFEPMVSSAGEVGVLGIRPHKKTRIDAWFGRLMTAIADQTTNVLAHIELERSMESTRLGEEREKLRSMLLSSVSHDLKTPLAGIIGALSVHLSLGERLSLEKRNSLLESSLEEAQRLDSFINNILEMTRLESGNIKFKQEWYSAKSMIDNVIHRLRHRLKNRIVTVSPMTEEVFMDIVMTEQVLQNILENACKYTQENIAVDIECVTDERGFVCTVHDHGEGLPPEKLSEVFDKYARLHKKDSQVAGTGLGLTISKAVLEAQGGWITAGNHDDGGAVFTFCLPKWRPKTMVTPEDKLACLL